MRPDEILSNYHRFQPLTDAEVLAALQAAQQRLAHATDAQAKMVSAMFLAGAAVMRDDPGPGGWRHLPWPDFKQAVERAAAGLLAPNIDTDSAILAAAMMACTARGIQEPGEPAPATEPEPATQEKT